MEEEYTVIEPVDDETEQDNDTATAGDVLNTLPNDAYLRLKKCIANVLLGDDPFKMLHHFNKYNLSDLQMACIAYVLKEAKIRRDEGLLKR